MKKTFIILIVVVIIALIGIGAYFAMNDKNNVQSQSPNPSKTPSTNPSTDTKTIVVTGQNFKFVINGQDNPDIKVKQGDKIKIEFTSTDGFHDFVIDELTGAKTSRVNTHESTSVEFTADKKGTFEYYCSVMTHRQKGMKGNFIVE